MPNWISYPSSVSPGGRAMTPAFRIRISNLFSLERNLRAQVWTEVRDARSHFRKVIGGGVALVLEKVDSISLIAARPLDSLRAER